MKQLSELKQGDKIYDITSNEVKWYTYLCVHPTGGGKYHILINAYENPIRIYGEYLQKILDQGFKTYQEAKLGLADRLEEVVKHLRKEKNNDVIVMSEQLVCSCGSKLVKTTDGYHCGNAKCSV